MKACFNNHSRCKSLLLDRFKKNSLCSLDHKDKHILNQKSEIRGIPVISENTIRAAVLQTEQEA